MNEAWIKTLEIEWQRQALISLLVLLVFLALCMWALYHVIKAAIRDGIRESGLLDVRRASWREVADAARVSDTVPHMPDMLADR
jgi:hypothetical protein